MFWSAGGFKVLFFNHLFCGFWNFFFIFCENFSEFIQNLILFNSVLILYFQFCLFLSELQNKSESLCLISLSWLDDESTSCSTGWTFLCFTLIFQNKSIWKFFNPEDFNDLFVLIWSSWSDWSSQLKKTFVCSLFRLNLFNFFVKVLNWNRTWSRSSEPVFIIESGFNF